MLLDSLADPIGLQDHPRAYSHRVGLWGQAECGRVASVVDLYPGSLSVVACCVFISNNTPVTGQNALLTSIQVNSDHITKPPI